MSYQDQAKQILDRIDAAPLKQLGQNFMIQQGALDKVVEQVMKNNPSIIYEVGPGLGFLTKNLATLNKQIIAVEVDKKYASYLTREFANDDLVLIHHADALDFNIEHQIKNTLNDEVKNNEAVLVGNIPYQISSPILDVILNTRHLWRQVVLTVQKDFAKRMISEVGSRNCGAMSVWMALNAKTEIICDFSADFFYPRPKVKSSLISFKPHNVKDLPFSPKEGECIHRIIKSSFSQRRKNILNGLTHGMTHQEKAAVKDCFENLGIEPGLRPEKITADQWICLGKALMIK